MLLLIRWKTISCRARKSYLLMFLKEQTDFRLFEYLQVKVQVYRHKVFGERIILNFFPLKICLCILPTTLNLITKKWCFMEQSRNWGCDIHATALGGFVPLPPTPFPLSPMHNPLSNLVHQGENYTVDFSLHLYHTKWIYFKCLLCTESQARKLP